MSFLDESYEAPATGGNYLKFKKGTTKIRILSDSITWRVDWNDNKPVRTKEQQKAFDPDRKPRHFRAFVVYDYDDKAIKVCEVTQKAIQNAVLALYKDEDWGDPKQYDLKITKEWDGMETKYTVNPAPAKELDKDIELQYKSLKIDLRELFEWWDPFNPTHTLDDLPF